MHAGKIITAITIFLVGCDSVHTTTDARASNGPARPAVDGIFLTHAHIGHYTGLMFLGHESMGAKDVPVWVMPLMDAFLRANGPWDQLVRYGNIQLRPLSDGTKVELGEGLSVTPILVPHRQEYSEVVAFRIAGPSRSVLYVPDIDSWEQWDRDGTRIEDVLRTVDVAYLDGTFFANGEIPGRDMTGFCRASSSATNSSSNYPFTIRCRTMTAGSDCEFECGQPRCSSCDTRDLKDFKVAVNVA